MPYAKPAADIMPVIDAPPTPMIVLAPGGRYLALVHYDAYPEVAVLARPYLPLAGLRIDRQLRARRRLRPATGLSVLRVGDGRERFLALPARAQAREQAWAN